jgi:bacteriocin biosynthesis cyclodehydratase domain-containing protein
VKLELTSDKLHSVSVNVIDMGDYVVIKRGRVEIKVAGEDAAQVVHSILTACRKGATREHLLELFAAPERETVEALVDHLAARRILTDGSDFGPEAPTAETQLDIFYWHFGTQTKDVRQRMGRKRIRIFGVNEVSRRLVAGLHASTGVVLDVYDVPLLRNERMFTTAGAPAADIWQGTPVKLREYSGDLDPDSLDCIVATSDAGSIEQMRVWNEFCVLHNRQFFPVLLQDLVGFVGPMVVPGETACFECLRSRQNSHLMDHHSRRTVEAAFIHEQAVGGFHPSMASILGDIAALEITKHFGLDTNLGKVGTVIEVNLLGSEMKARRVLKLPRCVVCSRLNRVPSTTFTKSHLLGPRQGEE